MHCVAWYPLKIERMLPVSNSVVPFHLLTLIIFECLAPRVASYSARALKSLLLDDALRPQAVVAGVPAIVCLAIKQWEDEVLCLRELLGAFQTLCWDKQCVRSVLQTDIVPNIVEFVKVWC